MQQNIIKWNMALQSAMSPSHCDNLVHFVDKWWKIAQDINWNSDLSIFNYSWQNISCARGLNPTKFYQMLENDQHLVMHHNGGGTFTGSIRTKAHYKFGTKGSVGVSRDCSNFWVPPIISRMGKATNFKFCMHIHTIDRNKSPLKISAKVAVGLLRDSEGL